VSANFTRTAGALALPPPPHTHCTTVVGAEWWDQRVDLGVAEVALAGRRVWRPNRTQYSRWHVGKPSNVYSAPARHFITTRRRPCERVKFHGRPQPPKHFVPYSADSGYAWIYFETIFRIFFSRLLLFFFGSFRFFFLRKWMTTIA